MWTVVLCAQLACGASAGGTTTSGIEPAKPVGQLTDPERATLCDWTNGLLGGYDKTFDCGMGVSRGSDETQMQCTTRLTGFTSCPLNVDDYETCVRRLAALFCAQEPMVPECDVYFGCLGVS